MSEIKTSIIPVGHHLLVLPEIVEEKTTGGIYIPETVRDKEQNGATRGTLISCGPNAWQAFDDGKPWAKPGDKVVFARYAGFIIDDDNGEKYRLINDEDIIAVIRQSEVKDG